VSGPRDDSSAVTGVRVVGMRLDERIWRAFKGPAQWWVIWFAHSKFNAGCHGLVRDDQGRVLLVQNRMWPIGKQWGAPGGYANCGEPFPDAVAREVYEETGYNVKAAAEPVHVKSGYKLRIELWYAAELEGGELKLDPKEVLDAGWFDLDALPAGTHPAHREVIETHQDWFTPKGDHEHDDARLDRTYLIFVGVRGCELRFWCRSGRRWWLRVGEGERDGNADQFEDTPLGRGGIGDFFDVLSGEVDCFSGEGVEVFE
jgi:8-oxo-dGTP diphosphatase